MHRSIHLLTQLVAVAAFALALLEPESAPRFPERLSQTGLFADIATRTLASGVQPYTPQYPLWSDGAQKQRWIRLPPGKKIDARDPDHWVFPVGTQFWKEFAFGRCVETRTMRRESDGSWSYAAYAWNAEGSEATLVGERGQRNAFEIRPGLRHDIPGAFDCRACHQGTPGEVLGFGALQLSSDRDPLAPHAETPAAGSLDLNALLELGLLENSKPEWSKTPPRIAARSARERAVLGYLHANCGSCHNSRGPLASLGLELDVRLACDDIAPALRSTLGVASRFRPRGLEDPRRLLAGDSAHSVLHQRMASRNPTSQMPPLGTRAVDETALALLCEWIQGELAAELAPSQRPTSPVQPVRQ
jgi:hypothetical protein